MTSLRHPSFQGLREDKGPADVVRETPAPAPPGSAADAPAARAKTSKRKARDPVAPVGDPVAPARKPRAPAAPLPVVKGVRISHPERVLYPDAGTSKLDLVRYYDEVSSEILPHLRGRPLTLVHCPEGLAGECRYMKHSKVWARGPVRRVAIREKTKIGEYLVIDDETALLSIAQLNILELHTWNTRAEHLEQPDRIVLDLDPGPEVPWREVVAAAHEVRGALRAAGLESWVKTTGGAGLHVVAPIVPERDWSACLAFSRELVQALAREAPRRYTVAYARAGREALILLDYLRNNRTNTSVAAFSTRARPGAPVSVPVDWDELTPRLRPAAFTLKTVPRRLRTLRADPWKRYWKSKQRLRP